MKRLPVLPARAGRSPWFWTVGLATLVAAPVFPSAASSATLTLNIADDAGRPLPCRIHLSEQDGQPHRPKGLPFWRDHFVCPGRVELELPAGSYSYQIERGPEHQRQSGSVELRPDETKNVAVKLSRLTDLGGWFSGDMHVHRPIEDIPLLMQAEDLHIAPVITWWNNRNHWAEQPLPENPLVRFDKNRFYHLMTGEDEREGGALMYFNLTEPLAITGSSREYPSPMRFLIEARKHDSVWVDIEKPFWWDVPVWLSSGLVDSIGLANNHMCRSQMFQTEAWGRPRDADRLPPPRGNGFWTQEIYYHILNCGLRIPPSAGSASGVLPNPLGYDRVYVHVGRQLDYAGWWDGLKKGRVFVTNGPLLVVEADGHLPGHVFSAGSGRTIQIPISASLTTLDPVSAIEVIRNGQVQLSVPWDKTSDEIELGTLSFDRSGWFLVRAITDVQHTFRFASTGPFYVEVGPDKHRISRHSARFFLDWVDERVGRVPQKLQEPDKLQEALSFHEQARRFWQDKVASAGAE